MPSQCVPVSLSVIRRASVSSSLPSRQVLEDHWEVDRHPIEVDLVVWNVQTGDAEPPDARAVAVRQKPAQHPGAGFRGVLVLSGLELGRPALGKAADERLLCCR